MQTLHTYYSLRYGTLSPSQLVAAAKAQGLSVLALTDINNTSCSYQFVKACEEENIKPIIGIEFRRDGKFLYTGLAKNAAGFRELNQLLTNSSLNSIPLPTIPPLMKNVFIIYENYPKDLTRLRDYEYLGIRMDKVNALYRSPLEKYMDKLVVFNPATFLDESGFKIHKLLRAIDLNIVITKLKTEEHAPANEQLYALNYLKGFYENYPEIIENTQKLFDACSIEIPSTFKNNRQTFTGDKAGDLQLLSKLAFNGCKRRYGKDYQKAMERVEKELIVIERMDFAPYFLITWDIIRYAQTAGYHHVGRGSGANSIVAFCLYITDVDPLELDLYFERFINPYRTSPPDFDIDFSWDERDDVTDYIFKRYGREHTALLATYNTFKGKSIIRELGKVFGLPKADIDLIVNEPQAKDKHHAYAKHIFKYGALIEGFPNYLSIHAGGVLITEEPINNFTALQLMPKGFPITHFDMYGAEDLNLHKFDILSQRGLGHIKDAVSLVQQNRGNAVDIHNVAMIKADEKVRAQLRVGDCIGCFYIESPAMRGLLKKLNCDNYVHLVAASSIIRPGVAKSGMMREYIHRFHHPESFDYVHPVFEAHLGETYGVMVYQEDVMKICHHFAGLDLDESDVLRRIMTGKKKSSAAFSRLRKKFFENCRTRNYSDKLSNEVWRQIESFSGYSFCKAHSASYAVESFQSLYLKAYYPLEFMVAVINNFGGFYRTEVYVHEARMSGGLIHAPCVNQSIYLTTIYDNNIFIGFIHLHQMERRAAHQIVHKRARGGGFRSIADFAHRVEIAGDQLDILIRIGAFRFTGMSKYELMWEKNTVFDPRARQAPAMSLFEDEGYESFSLPILEEGPYDQAFDEIELLGFPLCMPFDLLKEGAISSSGKYPEVIATHLNDYAGKQVFILGYYVARKHVTTVNKKHMSFGTWLDVEGHFFDTVHFPESLKAFPFRGPGCYKIIGKVAMDFDFASIEVQQMERLSYVEDKRFTT